jgi:protein gp37
LYFSEVVLGVSEESQKSLDPLEAHRDVEAAVEFFGYVSEGLRGVQFSRSS